MRLKSIYQYPMILLCGSIMITSCGINKKLADKKTEKGSQIAPNAIRIDDYYKQIVTFKSFSGKANLQIVTGKINQKVNANIKMNYQKDIWTLLNVMGVMEVARAYITPDSLKAFSKMQGSAYAMSYKDGLALIQPELEFISLQNLFLGNPLLTDKKNAKATEIDSNTISVTVQQDGYVLTLQYDKSTQLLKEQFITHAEKKFSCKITQSNYKPLEDKQPFAYDRVIDINNNGETTKLTMNFNKAEIDIPASVNFRIPDNYTIETIKK